MIRWGLDEPVSHFAIQFGNFIFDSDFRGFRPHWHKEWSSRRNVVYSLQPKEVDECKLVEYIANVFSGDDYDFGAYSYFCIRALMRKSLSIPLPTENIWANKEDPLCTGVAKAVQDIYPEWFSTPVSEFDIVTPFSLYENMRLSDKFIEE